MFSMHLYMIRWSNGRMRREREYVNVFHVFFADDSNFYVSKQRRNAKDKDKDKMNSATVKPADLRSWAKTALRPIERKLKGLYSPTNVKERTYGGITRGGEDEREISTSNLVQMLIQEAIDPANLVRPLPYFVSL